MAEEPILQQAAQNAAAAMAEAVRRNPRSPQLEHPPDSEDLKKRLPALARMSSQVMAAGDFDQVLNRVSQCPSIAEGALTHAGVAVIEARLETGQPFFAAAVFTARILPGISPELINQGRREFHVACHQCGGSYLMRVGEPTGKHAGSLIAVCPRCGRLIDVFGADAADDYHRPPWFMRGFCPKRIRNPLEAWRHVLAHVRYAEDEKQYGRRDVWQLAEATYRLKRGDCEDTSILLADWLGASGYPARVVLGEQGGAGHAWVVLCDGGRHQILETTGGVGTRWRAPLLSTAATRYVPRVQFDRTGLWFRTSPAWTSDYSSPAQWKRGPWPLEPVPQE